MTQQLSYDFTQATSGHPDYFYPLMLTLDPDEKFNFVANELPKHINNVRELIVACNVNEYFTKTIAQTNAFVEILGIRVRTVNFFTMRENMTDAGLHTDGIIVDGKPVTLEARINYFDLTPSIGAIRWWDGWWDGSTPSIKVIQATATSGPLSSASAGVVEGIRNDTVMWGDIPPPAFSAVSRGSALVRTNIPHHVIQGSGIRTTIGCQLVFNDGNPVGVWDHIRANIHKLGV